MEIKKDKEFNPKDWQPYKSHEEVVEVFKEISQA